MSSAARRARQLRDGLGTGRGAWTPVVVACVLLLALVAGASRPSSTAAAVDCGPAVTVAPSADAWIDQNSSASNKGFDSILKVQSKGPSDNFRALVRFSLPSAPAGCALQSATLRLFAASAGSGRTLQALRLAGAWTEGGVTWSNQPAVTGAAATTTSGTGYREWSVTAQVQAMYAGANDGFSIRDSAESGSGAEQQLHSREKGETPPQLVLGFAPDGSSPPPPPRLRRRPAPPLPAASTAAPAPAASTAAPPPPRRRHRLPRRHGRVRAGRRRGRQCDFTRARGRRQGAEP